MATRTTKSSRRPASAKSSRRAESPQLQSGHALSQQRTRTDHESAQFLRVRQKLVGKKTTDEYAQIRFVHRPDESTRKRNLHRNGNTSTSNKAVMSKRRDSIGAVSSETLHPQEPNGSGDRMRPHTAREAPQLPASTHTVSTENKPRVRPQSAKPQRESERDSLVKGQRVSVALLERTNYYNPIPLTAKLAHLLASRSTPRLQAALQYSSTTSIRAARHPNDDRAISSSGEVSTNDAASQSQRALFTDQTDEIPGRRHIVVHMQRLVVLDDPDDGELDDCDEEEEVSPNRHLHAENRSLSHRHASSSRQHARQDTQNVSYATTTRTAWQE